MGNVYDEVLRWAKPRSPGTMLEALDGQPSSYDIDGTWTPHHQGRPRSDTKHAFGDDDFVSGVRTIAYLAAMLPVGAPRRRALGELHRKMTARLANPELLLYGGDRDGPAPTSEAIVVDGDWVATYFRPAVLRDAKGDLSFLQQNTKLHWPALPYPWSSTFPVWQVWSSAGFRAIVERLERTNVPEGRWEIDPRASVPEIVERMRALHDLSEDSATLFLQYLTLADCADAVLAEINDWRPARYKAAVTGLAANGLVIEKKQPRAQRKWVLPGTWETLKPPNPALETWKLPLFDARMHGDHVAAPLGRILPLRPMPVLFEEAFRRHEAEAPVARKRQATASNAPEARNWMSEILATPDDDELRLVYADWLGEHDDPRGELMSLQVQHPERVEEARALIVKHRGVLTDAVHPYVKDVRFERGFIVGVTAKPLAFAKHAKAIFEACPFLYELTLDAGPVGPVQAVHWRALGECEYFARFTHLDTTPDHYISSLEDLELLLNAKYLPRLRSLKLGYHRTNEGFGLRGATDIASCERFSGLRFLELPGLQIGIKSLRVLLESRYLTNLETLRIPYNSIKDAQARTLVRDLEKGLAPSLRVLDFSNSMATTFVTAAVERFARNSVSDETAAEIARACRNRGSSPSAAP